MPPYAVRHELVEGCEWWVCLWFDITNDLADVFWQPSRMASSFIRLTTNGLDYCLPIRFVAKVVENAKRRHQPS